MAWSGAFEATDGVVVFVLGCLWFPASAGIPAVSVVVLFWARPRPLRFAKGA